MAVVEEVGHRDQGGSGEAHAKAAGADLGVGSSELVDALLGGGGFFGGRID